MNEKLVKLKKLIDTRRGIKVSATVEIKSSEEPITISIETTEEPIETPVESKDLESTNQKLKESKKKNKVHKICD